MRRLPQSRIRSPAPSRMEPCNVRSSTDKKSYPLFSGGPRPSPTGLCVNFELYLIPNSPPNPNLPPPKQKRYKLPPKKISPYSGGVGGIDSPRALVPEDSVTSLSQLYSIPEDIANTFFGLVLTFFGFCYKIKARYRKKGKGKAYGRHLQI